MKKYKILKGDNMAYTIEGEKPITVKLYKPTHAKLKIYATLNDKSLDEVIAETLNEISDIDITKFVEDGLKQLEKEDEEAELILQELDEAEDTMMGFNFASVTYVHPKKKVNVNIATETHKKLKIISSIYDESLETIASNAVENKVGEMDIVSLVSEEFNVKK